MARLEDLDDGCLVKIFDKLPPDQLMIVLGVNRRWRRLAINKLRAKIRVIALCESEKKFFFLGCTHLSSFSLDQVLVLERLFNQQVSSFSWLTKVLNPHLSIYDSSRADVLLNVSAKCTGVKSIEFAGFYLSNEKLLEVVRRCPELECIKLTDSYFEGNNWGMILDSVGHRIVHFVNNSFIVSNARLLTIVAKKCPNIRRVDWLINWELIAGLIASYKMLPKNCWRAVYCGSLDNSDNNYEDVFDELNIKDLDWNRLGGRVDRLSCLKFNVKSFTTNHPGVEFVNLKKLEFDETLIFDSLVASRFPHLEEITFSSVNENEDRFEALFQQMPSVKKLTLLLDQHLFNDEENKESLSVRFPSLSIRHLIQLEIIVVKITCYSTQWRLDLDFLQLLVNYVKEIGTLKKLVVDASGVINKRRKKRLLKFGEELKLKQNRVEIEFKI